MIGSLLSEKVLKDCFEVFIAALRKPSIIFPWGSSDKAPTSTKVNSNILVAYCCSSNISSMKLISTVTCALDVTTYLHKFESEWESKITFYWHKINILTQVSCILCRKSHIPFIAYFLVRTLDKKPRWHSKNTPQKKRNYSLISCLWSNSA